MYNKNLIRRALNHQENNSVPDSIAPGNKIQPWSTVQWINLTVSNFIKKKHQYQHWCKRGGSNTRICFNHLDAFCVLVWLAAAVIMRNRLAISVKDGLAAGLGAQHCSISVLHSESQWSGIVGLNVLFTMPPV